MFCTPIELDYTNMRFIVTLNRKRVKLQAITKAVDCKLINGPVLSSLVYEKIDDIEEIFVIKHDKQDEDIPYILQELITEHDVIFEEPVGLTHVRGVEHHILLKPGRNPNTSIPIEHLILIRMKLKKIVLDMLKTGIIQHNKSPFTSQLFW